MHLGFVDKFSDCDIRNQLLLLQALGFVWTTEDLLAHKKTPLHNPVALADRRKSSVFILLSPLLYGVNLVVISPPQLLRINHKRHVASFNLKKLNWLANCA
jgi:hypothetical protein